MVAESSSGFEYINEGTAEKPKPGYIATQPGSKLRLRLNTDRSLIDRSPIASAIKVQGASPSHRPPAGPPAWLLACLSSLSACAAHTRS